MLKKALLIVILGVSMAPNSFAWPTPYPTSRFIASQDVLPASSDSHSVGQTGNFFRNGYFRNTYMPYRAEVPSTVSSMGVVFASTDGELYFTNAAGTTEKISS